MNWYIQRFTQYAEFIGSARRSNYWYFVLINIVIPHVIFLVDIARMNILIALNPIISAINLTTFQKLNIVNRENIYICVNVV